jgi:hypothetical protein
VEEEKILDCAVEDASGFEKAFDEVLGGSWVGVGCEVDGDRVDCGLNRLPEAGFSAWNV